VCVGLLGEAPVSNPSLYIQLNVQCAILSVYLAALAQQVTGIAFQSRKLNYNVKCCISRMSFCSFTSTVCVCVQNSSKIYEWILVKFFWRGGAWPGNSQILVAVWFPFPYFIPVFRPRNAFPLG